MSKRNQERTMGAEVAAKAAVVEWLRQRGTRETWLVERMSEVGCPIARSGLWKMLHGDRAMYVDEAVAIMLITGLDLFRPQL